MARITSRSDLERQSERRLGFGRAARLIADWQWLILLLALPFILLISTATSPVLLLFPVLWSARKVGYGRFVPPTPINLSLALMLLMLLVSTIVTYDLAFSLPKIAGLLYGVVLFFAVVHYAPRSERFLWWGVLLLLLAGMGLVAVGLVGVDWGSKLPFLGGLLARLPQRFLSVPGSDQGINPNELAGVLLWTAPVALGLALGLTVRAGRWNGGGFGRWRRLAIPGLWFAALLQCGVVLLTQSRAALLGLAAGGLLMLFLLGGRYRRLVAGLVLAALLVGAYLLWQTGAGLVAETFFMQAGVDPTGSALNSLRGRSEIWSRAIYGIQDFPFTGMGMNTFRQVVHVLYPLFIIPPDADIAHAHNHLLQTALDLGLPGLIAYLGLWLGAGAMLWRTWGRAAVGQRALATGFAGALAAYFVYGFLDAVALGARPGFLFWLLFGLITSQYLLLERRQKMGGGGEPSAGQASAGRSDAY